MRFPPPCSSSSQLVCILSTPHAIIITEWSKMQYIPFESFTRPLVWLKRQKRISHAIYQKTVVNTKPVYEFAQYFFVYGIALRVLHLMLACVCVEFLFYAKQFCKHLKVSHVSLKERTQNSRHRRTHRQPQTHGACKHANITQISMHIQCTNSARTHTHKR